MNVKAVSYQYESRLSLFLVPETDVERQLLKSLWKHGSLAICNGMADDSGQGYAIKQPPTPAPTKDTTG